MTGAGFAVTAGLWRALVCPLIIIADAEGARENVDPDITTGEAPGIRVCEPITMGDGLAAGVSWFPAGFIPSGDDGLIAEFPSALAEESLPKAPAMIAPRPDEDVDLGRLPPGIDLLPASGLPPMFIGLPES